jgi:DNA-binding PucR family transcriptional regulator
MRTQLRAIVNQASRDDELVHDLLFAGERGRREAAWKLCALERFPPRGRVAVLAIAPQDADVAVDEVLTRVRHQLAPRHSLQLARARHALLVVSLADPHVGAGGALAVTRRVQRESAGRTTVAIGGVVRGLVDAARSCDQALRAADVAAAMPTFGDVVQWDDLGVYQMLTAIPSDLLGADALHPGLRKLLAARDLLATLERYLDLAGDMQQTAASLYLHRTTLYHRLRRIERMADVDLRKGDDRLALHLSMKLARLQGASWPS